MDYRIFFQKHDDHPNGTDHNTRGHDWKLFKPQSKKGLQCRVHFFSQRVINYWNDLPSQVVTASSVNSFKSRLDNLAYITGIKLDMGSHRHSASSYTH